MHRQDYKSDAARRLTSFNISMTQLNILHSLSCAANHCLTVKQIKNELVDASPNVSRALNKLMSSELIEKRRTSEDQRIVNIHLTRKGAQTHIEADKKLLGMELKGLSGKEIEQLLHLLKKI